MPAASKSNGGNFYAFLDTDGIHWDCANIQNDSRFADFEDGMAYSQ